MRIGIGVIFLFLMFYTSFGVAQQRNLTQFYNSTVFNNPAESGANTYARFAVNYRKQWPTIATGYQTSVFAFDA